MHIYDSLRMRKYAVNMEKWRMVLSPYMVWYGTFIRLFTVGKKGIFQLHIL